MLNTQYINLTAEQSQRIRDYRFEQRIESENEAIRRLIEAGLGKSGPATRSTRGPGGIKKPRRAGKSASKRQ